jgi:gag-polyprotein putative aspartyl protease
MADHRMETEKKLLDLNSLIIRSDSPRRISEKLPTLSPSPHSQTPLQDAMEGIYGDSNPPNPSKGQQQGPKPFPPQAARVNTPPERVYTNYPPVPQPSLHLSRQQSQQPPQQPLQPPFQPYTQESTPHPYSYPQQEPRQQAMGERVSRPRDIPPYEGEDGDDVWLDIKPPPFYGLATENFACWLFTVELFFRSKKLPASRYFANGLLLLEGFARDYAIEQVHRNNGVALTWEEFKFYMRERFDNPERRDPMLRRHLENLRYLGPARMAEFCTEFQRIEMQISDKELTLRGRLLIFLKSMPHELRVWINLSNPPASMDSVYQTARKWARANNQGHPQRIERIRIREHRERKQRQVATSIPGPPRREWKGATSTKSSYAKPTYRPKDSFHAMQQRSDSEYEEEYDSDYEPAISFNSIAMNTDDDSDDRHKADTEDETKTPKFFRPTYDAEIGGTIRKVLIATGASTIYVSQSLVNELGLRTTKVKARRVEVADEDEDTPHIVDEITQVDFKLGNLPVETLTAYVFPLTEFNLVLGLPWLKKHNPRVDFQTWAYEFTRNGKRYTLHPATSRASNTSRRSRSSHFYQRGPRIDRDRVPSSSHRGSEGSENRTSQVRPTTNSWTSTRRKVVRCENSN